MAIGSPSEPYFIRTQSLPMSFVSAAVAVSLLSGLGGASEVGGRSARALPHKSCPTAKAQTARRAVGRNSKFMGRFLERAQEMATRWLCSQGSIRITLEAT